MEDKMFRDYSPLFFLDEDIQAIQDVFFAVLITKYEFFLLVVQEVEKRYLCKYT